MTNGILLAILMIILFMVIRYIIKEKAKGRRCIGCPNSKNCNRDCK